MASIFETNLYRGCEECDYFCNKNDMEGNGRLNRNFLKQLLIHINKSNEGPIYM